MSKQQLSADRGEAESEIILDMASTVIPILTARNERLVSVIGCLLESIEFDLPAASRSDQMKLDIESAQKLLSEIETSPL